MEMPEGIDARRIEEMGISSNPILTKDNVTPLLPASPTSTLLEEGMLTARELREEDKENKKGSKPVGRP